MAFNKRIVSQRDFCLGDAIIVSATYDPVSVGQPVEVVIDSNVYGLLHGGNTNLVRDFLSLQQRGHRVNPLACCLEETWSNRTRFMQNYRAFRQNCPYPRDYEELPLGGREQLAFAFFRDGNQLEMAALRCYVLNFAHLLEREKDLDRGYALIRSFVSEQPIVLPAIAMLFLICWHMKRLRSQFRNVTELKWIEKFFALPRDSNREKLFLWASNRACDLYLLTVSAKVSRGNSHLGARLAGGVAVATADRFVSDVLFRYFCAGSERGGPFALDLDELVLLDPSLFDLLPKPTDSWNMANGGFEEPAKSHAFYDELWNRLTI
jgi:hypothetical protein